MTSTSLPENYPRYYTPGQVAAWAGVTSMTIIRWCDAGILHAVTTPGGHRRITEESVRDYLVKRGLPIPQEMAPRRVTSMPRVVLLTPDTRQQKAIINRLRGSADVTAYADEYRGLVHIVADPPASVLIDGATNSFEAARLVRALRDNPRTSNLVIAVWGEGRHEAARSAGATHVFGKDALDDLERAARAHVRFGSTGRKGRRVALAPLVQRRRAGRRSKTGA